ncbi:MAG TPA: FmdB family zinc ribbon protein [Acidimicrobiales bacterium]|nr:FmdB family zinc ribbon protein [Acidimicrobiales bacterium]
MPTYEYACKSCGQHLEVVQSFSDDPLTVCPACDGPLRKVFGMIGIAFKGSGFYKTDSREAAKSGASKAKSSSGSGSGADGASSGSSKETSSKESSSSSGESSSAGGSASSAAAAS